MENDLISRAKLIDEMESHIYWGDSVIGLLEVAKNAPSIEAEPVRHEGTTTYITTNDLDKYQPRIIVDEPKSKSCRVYYEDERGLGRWVVDDLGRTHCSKCGVRLPFFHCYSDEPCSEYDEEWDEEIPETNYCPNCGARMDGGAEG